MDNIDNAGMLSKSKGQILRVAATLHVMFHINTPLTIPDVISNEAVKAAIDLVDVCIQHAAFLAGRGDVNDRVEELARGTGHVDFLPSVWSIEYIVLLSCLGYGFPLSCCTFPDICFTHLNGRIFSGCFAN